MKKSLFAIFFIALMVISGTASIGFYLNTHLGVNPTKVTSAPVVKSFVDKYPFADNEDVSKDENSKGCLESLLKYRSFVDHAKYRANFYTNNSNPIMPSFYDLTNWYDDIFQTDIILNDENPIIRLSNGYFTFPFSYSHPTESWNNLLNFVSWLKERNIQFLSLIAADKGDDSFGTFPKGVPLGYSRMAEEYKSFLSENEIDYLESKPVLLANNSNFYYWFYKADHHWNVHAGRLMAEETARKLNQMQLAVDTNVAKVENFTLKLFPKGFLGSMGRKMRPRKQKYKEDLEIYYPKIETLFHIEIPCFGIDKTGNFDNTLISKQAIPNYSAFLYGDKSLIRIENLLSDNHTRALVIKQSKAEVFNPYFAMTVRYLDVIDPRYFYGSIRSFIEQTEPDIVITCVDVIWKGDEYFWRLK